MNVLDLTGYTYVGSYSGSVGTLSANTTYIVLPYDDWIQILLGSSSSSPTLCEVSGFRQDESPYREYKAKPIKFKTPSSGTWSVYAGHVFRKT